ncbi:VanZ family protein [Arthrobacter bambusae]|uniref:VanZ family protein n=1 Tax=Arthrobacter bambusae TaxID=1338426 RepID=UPI0027840F16|nr:VanZ family protein [Arthrobacter bambusae]MDQ0030433.1 glycopeptide antibiotics resistance protein [Arthrobacter bambusae]MDQ0098350.1 glycopeptide antibiotics resistance protein [Arthrobacter bambusae]
MDVQPQPTAATDDVPGWRLTTKRAKAETVAIFAAVVLYAAFLLRLLLFSRAPGSESSINLIPFASIAEYVSSHSSGTGRVAFANVVGNILIFVPLGVYVSWFRPRASAWLTMLTVASVSVAVEIIQGAFAVGASDIDDVILNCVGGIIGILTFRLLSATLRKQSLVRTAIAVLSVLSLPVWCYFLFIVRLHM